MSLVLVSYDEVLIFMTVRPNVLRKFTLDPVVVIFFKKCQKNYKCWSDPVVF